jgi:hypothetical protein
MIIREEILIFIHRCMKIQSGKIPGDGKLLWLAFMMKTDRCSLSGCRSKKKKNIRIETSHKKLQNSIFSIDK